MILKYTVWICRQFSLSNKSIITTIYDILTRFLFCFRLSPIIISAPHSIFQFCLACVWRMLSIDRYLLLIVCQIRATSFLTRHFDQIHGVNSYVDQIGGLGHARFRGVQFVTFFRFYGFFDDHLAMLYFLQKMVFPATSIPLKSLYLLARGRAFGWNFPIYFPFTTLFIVLSF